MYILALDTSAFAASVALCNDTQLLAEYTLNNGNTHSETILPMVEHVLSQCGFTVDNIDLMAVSAGPGSFTGVRIGVATVKGLGFGRKTPCIGVSTLEALADNYWGFDGLIVPVMNARRNQVYTAFFRFSAGHMQRLSPDMAISVEDAVEQLKQYLLSDEKIYCTGDGYHIIEPYMQNFSSFCLAQDRLKHQSAYHVAQVALSSYLAGNRQKDIELIPTYLRPSQAERTRLAQQESTER